ncbi:hypothetical protein ACFL56_00895 [Candidatus Margulisiibacteriota bacterium]
MGRGVNTGGARPGAGRKKKPETLVYEVAAKELSEKVISLAKEWLDWAQESLKSSFCDDKLKLDIGRIVINKVLADKKDVVVTNETREPLTIRIIDDIISKK